MEEIEYSWFRLCNYNGIGYKSIEELISYFGNPVDVFNAEETELKSVLVEKKVKLLKDREIEREIYNKYKRMKQENIRFIYRGHDEYPDKFYDLYDPPFSFYLKGKLPPKDTKSIAIIGARNASYYGLEMAHYFGRELAKAGINVISGLAFGADGNGHQGALEGNGYTLGILGGGINICYPKENYNIYQKMTEVGGIMSESGLDVKPVAGLFPLRNRLIAAMADGILVTEARERSGTRITVDQGLELGRDIFAIPGRNGDPLSLGCNRLIQSGAKLTTCVDDILEEWYGIEDERSELETHRDVELSKIEERIYKYLEIQPVYIDTLIEDLHVTVTEAVQSLVLLEEKGLVKQPRRNYYSLQI